MSVTKYQDSSLTKGIASETAEQWNLLQEDLSLPLAVIYRSRIENNLKWMQAFADSYQVKLAPHGKTTMAPDLFLQQKEAGAWAVTLATVPQVAAAYQHGLKRIIMANQLVGKQNMRLVSELILTGDLEFYCLVDSVENVQQLARFFAQTGLTLNLLIEISVPGGRCGCRNEAQIDQLAAEIALHPCLKLTGIEVYEGVIHGENAEQLIREFLADVIQACNRLLTRKAFDSEQIILTGAGSAWYDVVSDTFANTKLDKAIIPVIRPGCYLIHDTGIYQDAQKSVLQRNQRACDLSGDLQSALEVWTYVQSIPEPGFAVIAMGKRDVAFDAGLPTAELHYRPGKTAAKPASEDWLVTQIMDQHAFLTFPDDDDIKVGDMIAFSTSHPCLTFDKWKNIAVVDDQYNVTDIFKTCF